MKNWTLYTIISLLLATKNTYGQQNCQAYNEIRVVMKTTFESIKLSPDGMVIKDPVIFNFDQVNTPIAIDYDDGQGMHQPTGVTETVHYTTAGLKNIVIHDFNNSPAGDQTRVLNVKESLSPNGFYLPDEIIEAEGMHYAPDGSGGVFTMADLDTKSGKCTVFVKYAIGNTNKKLKKPYFFLEGYDPGSGCVSHPLVSGNLGHGGLNWASFCTGVFYSSNGGDVLKAAPLMIDQLRSQGFDVIYVDFEDGADWIQRNALALEDLIQKVNQRKVECNENLLVGPSMGGQIARLALTNMENNGIDHNTSLYISFDSPHNGANIPLSLQAMAYFTGNFGSKPDPELWDQLNRPVPQQLLVHHFNKIVTGSSGVRDRYQVTLHAAGYPKKTANVAIACGSGKNTDNQGFNNNDPIFIADLWVGSTVGEKVFIAALFACGGGSMTYTPPDGSDHSTSNDVIFYGKIPAGLTTIGGATLDYHHMLTTRTGNGTILNQTWYQLNTQLAQTGLPLITQLSFTPASWNHSLDNWDVAPGCQRNDISSTLLPKLNAIFQKQGQTLSINATTEFFDFMPTVSTLDIPTTDLLFDVEGNFPKIEDPNPALTPFSRIYFSKDGNTPHVLISKVIIDWTQSKIFPQNQKLPNGSSLTTSYNFSNDLQGNVPAVNVQSTGRLQVNCAGDAAFPNSGMKNDQHSTFTRYMNDCSQNIFVESGGILEFGKGWSNSGILVVEGEVHIKSGGNLWLANSSEIIIKEGGKLILDAGANVDLQIRYSKIIIRGELIVNGEFNFTGQGCFQFEQGNTLTLGNGNTTFKLVGQNRNNRFIRIESLAELVLKAGENIELKNGTIEATGRIELPDANSATFTNLIFDGMDYDEIIHAANPTSFKIDQSIVKNCFDCIGIENVKSTNIKNTDFENYYGKGVWLTNANAGGANFSIVDFEAADGIFSKAVDAVGVRTLNFNHCTFKKNRMPSGPGIVLVPSQASVSINLANVKSCILRNTTIENSDIGIANLDPLTPSQIYLYQCSEINKCDWGIFAKGKNYNGNPLPPTGNVGMVLLDGATLSGNKFTVEGSNILLQIDPYYVDGCISNNVFIKKYHPDPSAYKFFKICYAGLPQKVSMTYGFWGEYNSSGGISQITDPTSSNHMSIKQNGCADAVNIGVTPVTDFDNIYCWPILECFEHLEDVQDRNPEDIVGYGDCANSLKLNGEETVKSRFEQAYFEFLNENYDTAEALFQPLADLANSEGFQESSDCRSLVRIARAMTDHGEGVKQKLENGNCADFWLFTST